MNGDFKNRTIGRSFRDAVRGLWFCIKSERNMRIHTVMAAYILAFGGLLGLSRAEYALLIAAISIMITSEAFNTSIEKLCDHSCRDFNREIGLVKDISAGAVFISAVFAAGAGFVLLLRPAQIMALLLDLWHSPLYIFLLVLSAAAAIVYIILGPLGIQKLWKKSGKIS